MTKYRISVSIDGDNFFWVAINNERFIKNPTKEDLIGTKLKCYNRTNICPRCREENRVTDKSILYPGNAKIELDKEGKETGRWFCNRCKSKDKNNMLDSHKNIKKLLSDRRIGSLDPNSSQAKGDKFQLLTVTWRSTVSTIPVEDLNKKLDNYNSPIDHTIDSELGISQTKGCFYNSEYRWWNQNFENEHNQIDRGFEFNVLILYCASKDRKYIERLYIFPWTEILKRKTITIVKNPSKGKLWYEKYRVTDEDTIKKVNDIWKNIINR